MKAIICAAGIGSRMGEQNIDIPKCLTKINSESILSKQVKILNDNDIDEIYVIVGSSGKCWTKENISKINKICSNVIVNERNLVSSNVYSAYIAIEGMQFDDLLLIDGDCIFSNILIEKMLVSKNNLILTKKSFKKNETRNRVVTDQDHRVTDIGKHIPLESLEKPYSIYGPIIKVLKNDFNIFKELLYNISLKNNNMIKVISEFSKKTTLYKFSSDEWHNMNTLEEYQEILNYDYK